MNHFIRTYTFNDCAGFYHHPADQALFQHGLIIHPTVHLSIDMKHMVLTLIVKFTQTQKV